MHFFKDCLQIIAYKCILKLIKEDKFFFHFPYPSIKSLKNKVKRHMTGITDTTLKMK